MRWVWRSRRNGGDAPRRFAHAVMFRSAGSAQAPVNPSHQSQNEQKFGATEQDPAGGPKLPISNRQRGAIFWGAANWRDPVAGSVLPVFTPFLRRETARKTRNANRPNELLDDARAHWALCACVCCTLVSDQPASPNCTRGAGLHRP